MTTNRKTTVQQDVNDLIRAITDTTGLILSTPLMVDFFDGDHKAAVFLNQVLYWTDRTKDADGWFYKTSTDWWSEIRFSYYQIQRVIFGDERVQNPKRNLSEIGLETKVKMAPNGRNATFYRLDLPQFFSMFVEWAEQRFGKLVARTAPARKLKSKQKPAQTEPVASPTDNDLPLPHYPEPEPQVTPTERVKLAWEQAYSPDEKTILDAWRLSQDQLKFHLGESNFAFYIKPATLVDYDPDTHTLTLAVQDAHQVQTLQYRLHRHLRAVLSQTFGYEVEIDCLTHEAWNERHR
jgi:hypothetical protein